MNEMENIYSIETYIFEAKREEYYLGPLINGDILTNNGYLIRQFSKTIYPCNDRTVVIKVLTQNGLIGWGETYGTVAPKVIAEFFNDIIIEYIRNKNLLEIEKIHDGLYQLMRVRGYWGGFWLDALAALDIALCDIKAQKENKSLSRLFSDKSVSKIEAYISGLPGKEKNKRLKLAEKWIGNGFSKLKIKLESLVKSPSSIKTIRNEFKSLRRLFGNKIEIAIDMHWIKSVYQAKIICEEIEEFKPWFIEAPCLPEDIDGLKYICENTNIKIAVGEEWRTYYDAYMRSKTGISIMQPEIGHTGITEFLRINKLARKNNLSVIPHATISMGIFLKASLHLSSSLGIKCHEYQHSIMERNKQYIDGDLNCSNGYYLINEDVGLGVVPSKYGKKYLTLMNICK